MSLFMIGRHLLIFRWFFFFLIVKSLVVWSCGLYGSELLNCLLFIQRSFCKYSTYWCGKNTSGWVVVVVDARIKKWIDSDEQRLRILIWWSQIINEMEQLKKSEACQTKLKLNLSDKTDLNTKFKQNSNSIWISNDVLHGRNRDCSGALSSKNVKVRQGFQLSPYERWRDHSFCGFKKLKRHS